MKKFLILSIVFSFAFLNITLAAPEKKDITQKDDTTTTDKKTEFVTIKQHPCITDTNRI
jgi:hypothetical protein